MYSTAEIRKKFIDYFQSKNHAIVASSSLIPADDPTLLFVNAGMVQFKNMFLGAEIRKYKKAVTSQKCVRAGGKHNDLDQVGYTARHHTFFEMLGNFSFGDYFKEEAIHYAWDFLTQVLEIPKEKLLVTVFEEDDEAEKIWIDKIGVPADKVLRIGAKDNFWQMGDTGPCGPCSEIFYDHGEQIAGGPPGSADEDGDRFIEIWNLVFMQFDRQKSGELLPLPKPCVDTGMGLERISSILQGKHNNYDIDLFQHIISAISELLHLKSNNSPSLKVIADHIRTCAFLISDGVQPSNEGRGYVLRRIIRRAIRHGHKLGAHEVFFYKILKPLLEVMKEAYPELLENQSMIEETLKKEELRFSETLDLGMGILNKAIAEMKGAVITGDVAFKLYDTYGFPLDLTQDVAREHQLTVDKEGFNRCMKEQKQRSKASGSFAQNNQLPTELITKINATEFLGYKNLSTQSEVVALIHDDHVVSQLSEGQTGSILLDKTPFYAESGGQVGDIGALKTNNVLIKVIDTQKAAGQYHLHQVKVIKGAITDGAKVVAEVDEGHRKKIVLNHTATHLLHKVLQEKLGSHVKQKGSVVSQDKLRFDFSHAQPIDSDLLQEIEAEVNSHIRNNHQANTEIMSFDQAVETGAMALFGEKYGDEVRVLNIGGYSIELCGGTHVKHTGEIGLFKIISEASIASGIRRIEALTGESALAYIQSSEEKLNKVIQLTHASSETVCDKVVHAIDKTKELEKALVQLEKKLVGSAAEDLWSKVEVSNSVNFLYEVLESAKLEDMKTIIDGFKDKFNPGIIVLANHSKENKVQLVCSVNKSLTQTVKAGDIIRNIAQAISGKGGGRPDFAQGGGVTSLEKLKQVLNENLSEMKKLINIE